MLSAVLCCATVPRHASTRVVCYATAGCASDVLGVTVDVQSLLCTLHTKRCAEQALALFLTSQRQRRHKVRNWSKTPFCAEEESQRLQRATPCNLSEVRKMSSHSQRSKSNSPANTWRSRSSSGSSDSSSAHLASMSFMDKRLDTSRKNPGAPGPLKPKAEERRLSDLSISSSSDSGHRDDGDGSFMQWKRTHISTCKICHFVCRGIGRETDH